MGLITTFIAGLSFLVGGIIALFFKRKDNLINFSLSMSFSVLIILVLFEMLPESFELLENYFPILTITIGVITGIVLFMFMDHFIPHHGEDSGKDNLIHIGTVMGISLIIHNIIEGIFLYGYTMVNVRMGFMYAIAAALYHLPLGINLTFLLKDNQKRLWIFLLLLTFTPLFGGIVIHYFDAILNYLFLGIMLSITMGMIIYIIFAELLNNIKKNFNKYTFFGIITGTILILLGMVV